MVSFSPATKISSPFRKNARRAPLFTIVTIITLAVGIGANAVIFGVLNGVLLPFVLYFMLKLVNNKALMGRHTNSTWFNVVAWATTVIVIGLTVVMLWQQLHAVGKS